MPKPRSSVTSNSKSLPVSRSGTASRGTMSTFPDPLVAADGKARNAIRFLRVGEQMEVFVNERRVIYQPILPEVMLQNIHFQAVGASIDVTEFTLDELIPRL